MKRTPIKGPSDLSLVNLYNLIKKIVSHPNNSQIQGPEKMDGIFFSIGINEFGSMYFQTSNSPPMTNAQSYMIWVKEPSEFAQDMADFGQSLIDSVHFQRFLRVHAARAWPEKDFSLSFEYFPKKYANRLNKEYVQTIRVPHEAYTFDAIFFHDRDMYPGNFTTFDDVPCLVHVPEIRYGYFDAELGREAIRIYETYESAMKTKTTRDKPYRDEFRKAAESYFESLEIRGRPYIEGIVVQTDGCKVKFQHPMAKSYGLNPLIFKEKK